MLFANLWPNYSYDSGRSSSEFLVAIAYGKTGSQDPEKWEWQLRIIIVVPRERFFRYSGNYLPQFFGGEEQCP